LIDECVIYAQAVGAFEAGFIADPDRNTDHAARLGQMHDDRAFAALEKIAAMPAKTADSLEAKARIVPLIFQSDCVLDEREQACILSFAADTKAFLQTGPDKA